MSEVVHVGSGKVRELYAIDDERLLLTASDRISVFDVVLPTEIPDKGRVLTGLSAFWFARTKDVVANHLLGLRPRVDLLRLRPLLIPALGEGIDAHHDPLLRLHGSLGDVRRVRDGGLLVAIRDGGEGPAASIDLGQLGVHSRLDLVG